VNHEGVGDNVLSMPLLSIISSAFKDYERYLWLSRGRKDLFFGWDAFHLLDADDGDKIRTTLSKRHEFVFDLGTSNDHITDRFSQGELKYGTYVCFAKPKSIPREVSVPRSPEIPMWQQFISLVSTLGIVSEGIPDFGIQTSEFSERYADMLLGFGTGLPLICLAPGAYCNHLKRWPPEHFAMFIQELHVTRPCRFVLVGHPLETEIGDAITGLLEFEIDNLIGLTTLGSLIYILRQSKLLVANDNGAMHLGGLLGIPTIGLFGPTNPQVYSPMGGRSIVIAAKSGDVSNIDPEHVLNVSLEAME
jgi:ADP-heptose:LPS heptosyltransferase